MEIELTIENPDGEQSRVRASANTYDEALTNAKVLIPEGSRMLVIRKHLD